MRWAHLYWTLADAFVRARAEAGPSPTYAGKLASAALTGLGLACLLPLAVTAMALSAGGLASGAARRASAGTGRLARGLYNRTLRLDAPHRAPTAAVVPTRPPTFPASPAAKEAPQDRDGRTDARGKSDEEEESFFPRDAGLSIDDVAYAPHVGRSTRALDAARAARPTMPHLFFVSHAKPLLPQANASDPVSRTLAAGHPLVPPALPPTRGRTSLRREPHARSAQPLTRAERSPASPPRGTPSLSPRSSPRSSDDEGAGDAPVAAHFALDSQGSRLQRYHWLSRSALLSMADAPCPFGRKGTQASHGARFVVHDEFNAAIELGRALGRQASALPANVDGEAVATWDPRFLRELDAVELYCGPRRTSASNRRGGTQLAPAAPHGGPTSLHGGVQRVASASRRYVGQLSVQRKVREAFYGACPQLRTALVRATGGDVAWARQLFALSNGRSLEAIAQAMEAPATLSLQRGRLLDVLPDPTFATRHFTHLSPGRAGEVVLEAGTLFSNGFEDSAATFVAVKVRLKKPQQARARVTLTDVWLATAKPR